VFEFTFTSIFDHFVDSFAEFAQSIPFVYLAGTGKPVRFECLDYT